MCLLQRVYLRAASHLAEYFPAGGTMRLSASANGTTYIPLGEMAVPAGEKWRVPLICDCPDIQARYLRVEFVCTAAPPNTAYTISELAAWGR